MKTIQGLLLLAGMVGGSGCGGAPLWNALSSDPGYDIKRDAQGNAILLDTPRMWKDFEQVTDYSIAREVAGDTHWGTSKNANEAWIDLIRRIQAHREHPQKYIDYIIEKRRAAGLPELVGYP